MNTTLSRIIGILLITAAVVGLLFSTLGLAATWYYRPVITDIAQENFGLVTDALSTTAKGLELTRDALQISVASVAAVQNTMDATSATIESTGPMFDTIIDIAQNELPNSINSAQAAIDSATQSAEIIDNVMRFLTVINRDLYNPSVPMHVALQEISDSMDSLPAAFSTMEVSMTDAKNNLNTIKEDMTNIASDIEEAKTSLEEFDVVIEQYQDLVHDVTQKMERWESKLPAFLTLSAVVISIFLIWMAVAQLGLLTQGFDLVRRKSEDSSVGTEQENNNLSLQ